MRLALEGTEGCDVQMSLLVATPFDIESWHREVLGSSVVVERRDAKTRSGWPVCMYSAQGPDGAPLTVAFFTFFEYGAWAAIAGEPSDAVTEIMRSAEPVWGADGLVACLAELVS